jgi:rhodanese-related sulfurtransferase
MDVLLNLIKGRVLFALMFLIFSHIIQASAISPAEVNGYKRFATWQGIEPDKWATLWLIKRHIVPDAYFLLVPPNTDLPDNALPFGVPNVAIRRANRESMFRRLKQAMQLNAPEIHYLDNIIHDVEVSIWDMPEHAHSPWFETLYRTLQARYQRDQVPVDCYLAFFDGVARIATQENITADDYRDQLNLNTLCPGISKEKDRLVESLGHTEVLREISLGKKVIFLDTRENEEFDEVHLPGAKLLRLRDVNKKNVEQLLDSDLVVSYCVKDFRGFEVAKALKQYGVARVATLSPNGLKGWLNANLPVAGKGKMNEAQALESLMQCAMEPQHCGTSSAKAARQ